MLRWIKGRGGPSAAQKCYSLLLEHFLLYLKSVVCFSVWFFVCLLRVFPPFLLSNPLLVLSLIVPTCVTFRSLWLFPNSRSAHSKGGYNKTLTKDFHLTVSQRTLQMRTIKCALF